MTAHNLPIWKFILVLEQMREEGFEIMDIMIEDDFTIAIRGVKKIDMKKEPEKKDKGEIDWEQTI